MNRQSKITDEEFIQAVSLNTSMGKTIRSLNMLVSGSSYKTFRNIIQKLNINIDHWIQFDNKSAIIACSIPLEEALIENSLYSGTNNLKKKLIKANLLIEICSRCKIIEWEGEKLSLHLDHINGVRTDNRIENLRLLCPNCHSLTDTYCGKNSRYRKCIDCDERVEIRTRKRCYKCGEIAMQNNITILGKNKKSKVDWPSTEILKEMVVKTSYSATGREFGVTGNTVKKRIKNHP